MDEFLKSLGHKLTYDQLTADERDHADKMYDALQKSKLSLETVREAIAGMREAVVNELTKHTLDPREDIFLKARLRNYLLIEALLTSPERAKRAIERSMGK